MLPLRDKLRAIIHNLRMETLLNVEPCCIPDLRSRILKLPSTEELAAMPKEGLEELQHRIEHLMFDFDKATNHRSKQRALRDFADKGIPPYRKPLLANWYTKYKFAKTDMYDMFEKVDEFRCSLLNEYFSPNRVPGSPMSWDVIPLARLKKIWEDYVKNGVVRDESGMNAIANQMLHNLAKLQAATDLSGHSQMSTEEIAESCGSECPDGQDSDFYFSFLETKYGTPISDYGLEKLWKLAQELMQANSSEEQLLITDKMLQVVHQRGDLASLFVEGGSSSLSQLSAIKD